MKEIINTPNAPAALGPYSQAKRIGNLLAISGQIAIIPGQEGKEIIFDNASPGAETHRILCNMGIILDAAGCSFEDVLKTTIFIRDAAIREEVNKAYAEYFDEDSAPARSCVVASPPIDNLDVEIEALVVVPEGKIALQPPHVTPGFCGW